MLKDWLLSHFAHWLIGRHFTPYGHMTSFHIDTENKKIALTADLKGEASPIELEISYLLREEAGQTVLNVTGLTASREWVTELARAYLPLLPVNLPVPEKVAPILRVLKV